MSDRIDNEQNDRQPIELRMVEYMQTLESMRGSTLEQMINTAYQLTEDVTKEFGLQQEDTAKNIELTEDELDQVWNSLVSKLNNIEVSRRQLTVGPLVRFFNIFNDNTSKVNEETQPLEATFNPIENLSNIVLKLMPEDMKIKLKNESRREFMADVKSAAEFTAKVGLASQLAGFATIFAQDEDNHGAETESDIEHHNPNHISKQNIIGSTIVAANFVEVIGTQITSEINPHAFDNLPKGVKFFTHKEMSPKSTVQMATAWAVKMAILNHDIANNPDEEERIASEHAFDHEMDELINLGIGAGLVALSELTSHIHIAGLEEFIEDEYGNKTHRQIEEAITTIFGDEAQTIKIGGIDVDRTRFTQYLKLRAKDLEEFQELGNNPSVEDIQQVMQIAVSKNISKVIPNIQDIEPELVNLINQLNVDGIEGALLDYIDRTDTIHVINYLLQTYRDYKNGEIEIGKDSMDFIVSGLKSSIANKLRRMEMVSVLGAPFSLTFTSASLSNKVIPDITTDLVALRIAERLLENNFDKDEILTPEALLDSIKEKVILQEINGPGGLVNLAVTTAANINGAALIGDPPNIFFLINRGLNEWLDASLQGFIISLGVTMTEYEAYIATNLGLDNIGLPLSQTKDAINLIIVNTVFRNIANGSMSMLKGLVNNLPMPVKEATYNKMPFLKSDSAINYETLAINIDSLSDNWRGKLKEGLYGNELIGTARNVLDFGKALIGKGAKTPAEQIISILESQGDYEGMIEITFLNKVLENLGGQVDNILDSDLGIDEKKKGIFDLMITQEAFQDPLTHNALHQAIDSAVNHEGHEEHEGHYKHLSHNAKEVRDALMTQLFAVGSLQTLTKKILKLDQQDPISITEAKGLSAGLYGLVAAMSSSADNVAAMIFGIDVLLSVADKYIDSKVSNITNVELKDELQHALNEFRTDQLEGLTDVNSGLIILFQKLQNVMAKNGFLGAVFGGNLLKFGNGANMSIEKVLDVFIQTLELITEGGEITNQRLEEFLKTNSIDRNQLVRVSRRPNQVAESALNYPAWFANIVQIANAIRQTFNSIDDLEEYFARAA